MARTRTGEPGPSAATMLRVPISQMLAVFSCARQAIWQRQLRVAKAYDNGIVTGEGALHVGGIHRITFDNCEPWRGRELRRIARKSSGHVAIRQQLRNDSAARAAGGSENDDVHASNIGARRATSRSRTITLSSPRRQSGSDAPWRQTSG